MKKIDLHIHTVKTVSDRPFVYSLEVFKRYVQDAALDAVAITNHDVFDADQFREIQANLGIVTFPGIEISLAGGHVLLIAPPSEVDDFERKAVQVTALIHSQTDTITFEVLQNIYKDLTRYLVIPHYQKHPAISGELLEQLRPYISAGEVDSTKKFNRVIKDEKKLTPVLFSDARMHADMTSLPTRQTFVNCGTLTIEGLKASFKDRSKVTLSARDGNKLWPIFDNGQLISSGLNIVIGARSSGKTYLLDQIAAKERNTKYIRQFFLVQQDEAASEQAFKLSIERQRSDFTEEYFSSFKNVLEQVTKIDLAINDRSLAAYVESLVKSAVETDRKDNFSKTALFDESDFSIVDTVTHHSLIKAVVHIIENIAFRPVIEQFIELTTMKELARKLIEILWQTELENSKKHQINGLLKEVQRGLHRETSAVVVSQTDFYKLALDKIRVSKFCEIAQSLKKDAIVFDEQIQDFRIEAVRKAFKNATDIRTVIPGKSSLRDIYSEYDRPYQYLRALIDDDKISPAELHKFFAKIEFRILNKDGFPVSGGEKSEFRLLQEIADAHKYDLLLIDEPESSFDNLFLKTDVNRILKSIASSTPVLVVTHNNTVGASMGADYFIHTRKELENGRIVYRMYSGYPTDKTLFSVDGLSISSHLAMMDALEAGEGEYDDRRQRYEAIKN